MPDNTKTEELLQKLAPASSAENWRSAWRRRRGWLGTGAGFYKRILVMQVQE